MTTALIVNPSSGLADEFESTCTRLFGRTASFTKYERPFDDAHPKMRPDGESNFEIIVMDLGGWASADEIATLQRDLPRWVEELIRSAPASTFVVIVCEDNAYLAIAALARSLHVGQTPFVCHRSLGQRLNKAITDIIHDMWRRSASPPPTPASPQGDGAAARVEAPTDWVARLNEMLGR